MRIVVVDNNPESRSQLASLLSQEAGVNVTVCRDDPGVASRIAMVQPDVLFYDPGLTQDGRSDTLRVTAGRLAPLVVVVASQPAQALRAFDVQAFDCIGKPAAAADVRRVLERAVEEIEIRAASARVRALISLLPSTAGIPPARFRLVVRVNGRERMLRLDEILSVKAACNYVVIQTTSGPHRVRATMSTLEHQLGPGFLRVHRSMIVNVDHVQTLKRLRSGAAEILMTTADVLQVTRSHREAMERRLDVETPGRASA